MENSSWETLKEYGDFEILRKKLNDDALKQIEEDIINYETGNCNWGEYGDYPIVAEWVEGCMPTEDLIELYKHDCKKKDLEGEL